MEKRLKNLLLDIPKKPQSFKDIVVKGIASDSRKVKKGYLFVAIKGLRSDGHDFIGKAIDNGASVIISEKEIKNIPDNVVFITVSDSRKALGKISSAWYENPAKNLKIIGITGTKGKTTTVYILHHILKTMNKKVGFVSSIKAQILENQIDTGFHTTTPDIIALNKLLKQMKDKGCEYAVLEVSSHGIDQGRISGIPFEVAALTNIAPEHLDYHKSLKEYKNTKVDFLNEGKKRIISKKQTKINVLPGKFNNLNAQLAVDIAVSLGFSKEKAINTLSSFVLPKGRMEKISNDKGIDIYVDFAHTPDSVDASLSHLKTKTKGRLISVFGSAGERDTKKRPKMTKIALKYSDLVVLTAEDPRDEDVLDILSQMKKGVKGKVVEIPERSEAIVYAISNAKKGDTVAILGKGHEKSMAFEGIEHPWSDHKMVKTTLNLKDDMAAIILAAGKGTRMNSQTQKVLRKVAGKQMITYTLLNLRKAFFKNIVLVVSHKKQDVIKRTKGFVEFVDQEKPLGTGHALQKGLKGVSSQIKTVVALNGDDSGFYSPKTIKDVIKTHLKEKRVLTFVSLQKNNPEGLGRVLRDKKGKLLGIVEEKVASESQKQIKEVNDGLYVFERKWLEKNIKKIKKSKVGEYYIVDLIKIGLDQNRKVGVYKLKNSEEWQGINTEKQLKKTDKKMRKLLKSKLNENK